MSDVELGIELERTRLGRYKYLLMLRKRELDYEGLWDSMELITGFDNRRRAIRYCEYLARASLVQAYVAMRSQWPMRYLEQRLPCDVYFKVDPDPEVSILYARLDRLHDGTGFNKRYWMWWVLEDKSPQRIGPALYRSVNDSSAWNSYFRTIGEAAPQGVVA